MNVKKLMKEKTTLRISNKAIELMEAYAETYVKVQTARSELLAKHAGRKTIKDTDVGLALK